jgi:hypothetical protein
MLSFFDPTLSPLDLLMYLEIGYLESTTDNLNFLVEK